MIEQVTDSRAKAAEATLDVLGKVMNAIEDRPGRIYDGDRAWDASLQALHNVADSIAAGCYEYLERDDDATQPQGRA